MKKSLQTRYTVEMTQREFIEKMLPNERPDEIFGLYINNNGDKDLVTIAWTSSNLIEQGVREELDNGTQ